MLKICICPKCFNFRIVSRKPDAMCFHCGMPLVECNLEYSSYIDMSEEERNEFRSRIKERIHSYYDRLLVTNSARMN